MNNPLKQALVTGLAKIDQHISLLTNATVLQSRELWASAHNANGLDAPGRDLNRELGRPCGEPDAAYYETLVRQDGLSHRVNAVFPDECWSGGRPTVYETEKDRNTAWEVAAQELERKNRVSHYLHRLDVECGKGRFGAMLIGLDDGLDPSLPARGLHPRTGEPDPAPPPPRRITFLRPCSEAYVKVAEWEADPTCPRYGLPYSYDFAMEGGGGADPDAPAPVRTDAPAYRRLRVHWSRVQHALDNPEASDVFGVPRLRRPLPYLLDARKVSGSSAEMFYKGAFPGLSLETFPEIAADADLDAESVREEMDAYMNGLRRYLRLVGMTAKSLAPQIADPTNHLTVQLQLISATTQVPVKVLLGSEAGHLAAQDDTVRWNRRLSGRQNNHLTDTSVRPFYLRASHLGVLPRPRQVLVAWADMNAMSDKDRAQTALQRTQSLLQYVTSGAWRLVRPLHFLTTVMGLTLEEAHAVVDAAGGEDKVVSELDQQSAAQNGLLDPAKTGTDPAGKTGGLGRRNAQGKA